MSGTIVWEPRTAIWWALREDGEKQADLASRAGIDPSKLSRLLSGETKKLDILVLQRIAEAQGRPLDYYTKPPDITWTTGEEADNRVGEWFRRPIEILATQPTLKAA
jgi:transcriptional regulator with XRE-family HTH domain